MTDKLSSSAPFEQDGLPPRQETFLAYYPRKLKMAVLIGGVLLALAPAIRSVIPQHTDGEDLSTELALEEPVKELTPQDLLPPLPEKIARAEIPVAEKEAVEKNDKNDGSMRMAKAPDPELIEGEEDEGFLPIVGKGGRQPWQVYARPFDYGDKRPRIAIVVTGLGLSRVATDSAIQRLPAQVTLAFESQGALISKWLLRARDDGHETLLTIPVEPFDYPRSDPGPNSLLTSVSNDDNITRLQSAMRQGVGYFGVLISGNSRMATDAAKLVPVLKELRKRGLFVFETHASKQSLILEKAKEMDLPAALSGQKIDAIATPDSIDAVLGYLEQSARITGKAIGLASPLPLTLERLSQWTEQLAARGIVLAPLSTMAE